MKADRFTTKPAGTKVAVYRHSVHYPRGVYVHKFSNQEYADFWIARQVSEDQGNRLAKITDYLAERKARPAIIAEPSAQLSMF